jgi:hypothetical protein
MKRIGLLRRHLHGGVDKQATRPFIIGAHVTDALGEDLANVLERRVRFEQRQERLLAHAVRVFVECLLEQLALVAECPIQPVAADAGGAHDVFHGRFGVPPGGKQVDGLREGARRIE